MTLSALLAVVLFSGGLYASEPTHVVIMHTGDLHGRLQPAPGSGGAAALATVVRRERPDLMLDAGDSFFGTMISNMFEGAPMIDVMNAIGYDAAVVGHTDFNFGIEGLGRRVEQANFPFTSANTNSSLSTIGDAAIFSAQGIRFAIIGLTSPDVMKTGHPGIMRGIDVTDVIRTAEKVLTRVRDISDVIVFLTHLRLEEEIQLAKAFPEVRLIIGGHDHSSSDQPVRVGDTTIVRSGSYGKFVGRIDLLFEAKKLSRIDTRLIALEGVEPDVEIQQILKPYETRISRELDTVLGHAEGDMTRSLTHESHVGDLVADALRAATGTQITLNSAGAVRIGIPKGPVTERMVYEVVPFDNSVITMKLTGAQIKEILGRGLMNVSGIRVKFDAKKPAGRRLVSATLSDGKPLRDSDLYTVSTTDGFEDFRHGVDVRDTGLLIREAVSEHIRTVRTLIPHLDGRIQVVN